MERGVQVLAPDNPTFTQMASVLTYVKFALVLNRSALAAARLIPARPPTFSLRCGTIMVDWALHQEKVNPLRCKEDTHMVVFFCLQ